MYCSITLILSLARGVGALILVVPLFLMNLNPIINVILLIGSILLLRGCIVCWLIDLSKNIKIVFSGGKK